MAARHGQLSAANSTQVLVPKALRTVILTLEPDTEVLYKVDAPYAADHEAGVAWDDPDLAVPGRSRDDAVTLSEQGPATACDPRSASLVHLAPIARRRVAKITEQRWKPYS
jgi:hypothetical protein